MCDAVPYEKSQEFITESLAFLLECPCRVSFIDALLFGSGQFGLVHAQHLKIITKGQAIYYSYSSSLVLRRDLGIWGKSVRNKYNYDRSGHLPPG
jgi:hypothetical protein